MSAYIGIRQIVRSAANDYLSCLAHYLSYFQNRPGQDKLTCSPRPIFNGKRDQVEGDEVFYAIKKQPSVQVAAYMLLLAPNRWRLDVKTFTREIFSQYKIILGVELDWYAVAHENTNHSHTHALVMPTDARNNSILLKKIDQPILQELANRWLRGTIVTK